MVDMNLGKISRFPERFLMGGSILIYPTSTTNEWPERLAVLGQGNFRLTVSLLEYNDRTEKYLEQLVDAHMIESLDLRYHAYDWVDERLGEEVYTMTPEEELLKANIAVNLNLKLPHVKEVSIELDSYFTAEAQLEPFLDLPSGTKIFIEGVTDDAAKFLLETAERWPDASCFDWSEGDNLGEEMEEEMLQRFPHPELDLGGSNGNFGGVF